jgi:DNA-binding HxlR family transcriptional regulator
MTAARVYAAHGPPLPTISNQVCQALILSRSVAPPNRRERPEKIREIKDEGGFFHHRYRIESLPMVGGGLDYSAPFQRAIELIGKRWTGAVVKALIPAPARFNQLLAGIPGISDRVLTERLRELETEGLVERLVDPGPPVRVSYRLTSRGRALEPVLAAVANWADSWLTTVEAAVG